MYAAMYTHMYQHNIHREVKYYIVGVVLHVAKQFIVSYNNKIYIIALWSNGLRHHATSQRAAGSISSWGDFFQKCSFCPNFFFQIFKSKGQERPCM